MSHNDYTKYARENKVVTPEAPVEVNKEPKIVEVPVEVIPVVEPIVEETQVIETSGVSAESAVEPARTMGRVIGCTRLNVRRAPKPRAEVICEINCDAEVEIDDDGSTIDFYKICTASGVEGYCVKTYISVSK